MTVTPRPPDGGVLALDPGIQTGVAVFDIAGRLGFWSIYNEDEMLALLAVVSRFGALVYEDYRLRYGQPAPKDPRHVASLIIGAARLRALQHEAPTYGQEVEVLTIASMHTGLKRPSDHKTGHRVDAILHGAYFFERLDMKPDLSAYRSSPVN